MAENDSPPKNAATTEDLQARLEQAEAQRDEYLALSRQIQADFENYQKRNHREREQERRYWNGPLVLDLLPVIDNLNRATEAAKQVNETGPLVQGVAMVQSQIIDVLRRYGITPIDALGKPFDPNVHQAVMQQPRADVPPNAVVSVLEQGFMIADRVLRPAAVIVSKSVE